MFTIIDVGIWGAVVCGEVTYGGVMGFFDELFKVDIPHRTFGADAKEYCVAMTLSEAEKLLVDENCIDVYGFVSARIALRVNLFNLFFVYHNQQRPSSGARAAQSFFIDVVQKHYAGLPEPLRSKMAQKYPGSIYPSLADVVLKFCCDVQGGDVESESEELQNALVSYGGGCAEEVSAFFKKNMRKIS